MCKQIKKLGASNSAVSKALEYATSNGWEPSLTKGGHIKYVKQGRQPVYGSQTSSDYRSWKNLISIMRREDARVLPDSPLRHK